MITVHPADRVAGHEQRDPHYMQAVPSQLFYLPRCPGWIKSCTTDESNNSLGIDTYRCPVNHFMLSRFTMQCAEWRLRFSLFLPP